ncbi:MAG: hypothetical protein CMP11_08370 [Zetaproteobacteria bacterium]|nr:hypothetical protein [Pseudobdellovibrionaceae bacterium]
MVEIKIFQKLYYKIFLILLFVAFVFILSFKESETKSTLFTDSDELKIKSKYTLPLREISGLSKIRDHDGRDLFYAVGDKYPIIVKFEFSSNGIDKINYIDFSQAIIDKFIFCNVASNINCKKMHNLFTTQWEALHSTDSGYHFILHEQLDTIFLYNHRRNEIVSTINLNFNDEKTRHNNSNGMGEGFILLNNNHLLSIKERSDPSISEFSEKSKSCQGYSKDKLSTISKPFKISPKIYLEKCKTWALPKKLRSACDLSELVSSPQGNLYLLSQKCNFIAKIKDLDLLEDKIDIVKIWKIPSQISKAEALLVLEEEKLFLVAEDNVKVDKPNIFLLESDDKKGELLNLN